MKIAQNRDAGPAPMGRVLGQSQRFSRVLIVASSQSSWHLNQSDTPVSKKKSFWLRKTERRSGIVAVRWAVSVGWDVIFLFAWNHVEWMVPSCSNHQYASDPRNRSSRRWRKRNISRSRTIAPKQASQIFLRPVRCSVLLKGCCTRATLVHTASYIPKNSFVYDSQAQYAHQADQG